MMGSAQDVLNVWRYDHNMLDITSTFTPPTGRSCCLAWNHTNQVVATGGISQQIHLIQASNGNILSSLQVADSQSEISQTNAVAFAGNSRLLAAALGSSIQLWDLKKRQMKTMMSDHQTRVSALCFLPAGELISGDTFGAIRIWDAKAYKSSPELIIPGGAAKSVASITSLSISPSGGKSLAAGYTDGVLGVWDSASCTLLRKQLCHTGRLTALAYSPRNAKLVTTGGSDGRVTLIDTSARNNKDPSAVIEVPGGVGVTSVSFHEDAIHTAVGLSSGKILVYDWRNLRKPVASTPAREAHPVLALAFQVPKTSASGGDSVASSRQSRSVVAAPLPVPPAIPAPTLSSPAVMAVPGGIATSTTTAQSNTSTDVPLRRVPATPPRVASPAPSHASGTQPPAPSSPKRSTAPEMTESLQKRDFSDALNRVQSAMQEASSPPSSLQRRHNVPATPPTQTNTSSKASNRSDSGLVTIAQPEPFMTRLDRAAQSLDTQKQPAAATITTTTTNISAARAPLQPDIGSTSHSFSSHNGNVGNNNSVVSTGLRRSTAAPVSEEESPQLQLEGDASYTTLRQAVQPVTARDLEEALDLLRYDVHKEVQAVIREQVRQFSISKDDTAELLRELNAQMADLLRANQELRAENERLRRIY